MALDKATVARVARLARIHVESAQLAPLAAELSNILGWIEQLNEVDTDGVAPLTSVAEMTLRLRADVVTESDGTTAAMANAPEVADSFYVVPKVIDG